MVFYQRQNTERSRRRREWLRISWMVALLLLVLVAMNMTSDPDFWWWLFPEQAEQSAAPTDSSEAHSARNEFAARLLVESEAEETSSETESTKADAVEKPQPVDAPESSPDAGHREDQQRIDEMRQAEAAPSPESPTNDGLHQVFDSTLTVQPELLQSVEDSTLGVRRQEAEAYYTILRRLRATPLHEIEEAARRDVTYTVLMADSDRLRGVPILIEGRLRRLTEHSRRERRPAAGPLFDAWIFTRDSGNEPYHVVCTEVAENIPRGERLSPSVPVRVAGLFFKQEGYASEGGMNVAPLLLAKRLEWLRTAAPDRLQLALAPYFAGFAVLVAAVVGLLLWRFAARDKAFRRHQTERLLGPAVGPPESLEASDGDEPSDFNRA